MGDILENKPRETDSFHNVIIVDGVPQVGPDRLEKLKGVILQHFGIFGMIVNDYYPKDNGHLKG